MEPSAWSRRAAAQLATVLAEPLVVVDVGCRWGFADSWASLGSAATVIGFDPDTEECARLRARYAATPGVRLVDRALGDRSGPATLHLTREPGCSSLYPPDEQLIARYPSMELHTPVGTTTVELTTLDEWCRTDGLTHVDALKLDVQGAELDVLRGATGALATVQALQVEVQMHPMYVGVPRFADVDDFLVDAGFVLWRLGDLAHQTPYGARSRFGVDVQFTDRRRSRFESRPGRLFFANAWYARPALAEPLAAGGAQPLLRAAAVANGFELHDLAAVNLEAAAVIASGTELHAIEALLAGLGSPAPPPVGASGAPSAGEPGTTGAELLVGPWHVRMDEPFAGAGWHPPQALPAGAARWTGPGRDAWIELPGVVADGATIDVLVVASLFPDGTGSIRGELDDVELTITPVPDDTGVVLRGVAPSGRTPRRASVLRLQTPEPLPWPDGSDPTLRGVAIGRITGSETR